MQALIFLLIEKKSNIEKDNDFDNLLNDNKENSHNSNNNDEENDNDDYEDLLS